MASVLAERPGDGPLGWQPGSPSPSSRANRRRWGGFFSAAQLDEFVAAATHRSQPAHGESVESTQGTTTAATGDLRRHSLSRSNAVCSRRCRSSRFSADSSSSLQSDVRQEDGGSDLILVQQQQQRPAQSSFSAADSSPNEATALPGALPLGPGRLGAMVPAAVELAYNILNEAEPIDHTTVPDVISHTDHGSSLNVGTDSLAAKEDNLEALLATARRKIDELERQKLTLSKRLLEAVSRADVPPLGARDLSSLAGKWVDPTEETQIPLDERRQLEDKIARLENLVRQHAEMTSPLVQEFRASHTRISENKDENEDSEVKIQAFRRYTSQLSQSNALVSSLGDALTPRALLFLKFLQHQTGAGASKGAGKAAQGAAMPQNCLDVPLDVDRATKFCRSLESQPKLCVENTSMKVCAICYIPKFVTAPLPSSSSSSCLSEFDPRLGTTSCCSKPVCKACLSDAIVSGITTGWWHNLGSPHWLRCPVPSCSATLPIRYNVDLSDLLRSLGDAQPLHHVMRFERANLLRAVLEGLSPQPTADALTKAADLHAQLAKHGRMRDFFELRRMLSLKIDMLPVDTEDGERTLLVPMFTHLFIRRRRPCMNRKNGGGSSSSGGGGEHASLLRECVVCAESIPDIVDGTPEDEDRWATATAGFPGDWQAHVRVFPPPWLVPECGRAHKMEVCRRCLSRHLEQQLETQGRAGCERLSCPLPDCRHVYTHGEVKSLATPETFAKYDKFRLLSHLATLPNFRWCLREGCEAGQIYDDDDDDYDDDDSDYGDAWDIIGNSRRPNNSNNSDRNDHGHAHRRRRRIACDACGFEMCFSHQVPWHAGLSCAEYDARQRAGRGDPDIEATRAWISENTKPCPGPRCGVPVEKKGGCFHMTCATCRFEFCWECLADWNKIVVKSATTTTTAGFNKRKYERRGHKVGCYFRGADAALPTMLVGNDLEAALRGM